MRYYTICLLDGRSAKYVGANNLIRFNLFIKNFNFTAIILNMEY